MRLPANPFAAHRQTGAIAIPLVIFLIGAACSFLAYWEAQQADDERARNILELRAEWRARDFEDKINSAVGPVEDIKNLLASESDPTLQAFQAFAENAGTGHAVVRLMWAPVITAAQREGFEAETARKLGIPGYRIVEFGKDGTLIPEAERPTYAPVALEFIFHNRRSLLGFDQFSDTIRRETAERSQNEGEPIVTVPVAPLSNPAASSRMVVYWPVYAGPRVPDSFIDRHAQFKGFAVGAFDLSLLFANAVAHTPNIPEKMSVLIDTPATDPASVPVAQYDHSTQATVENVPPIGSPLPGELRLTRAFTAVGRTWALVFDFPAPLIDDLHTPARWGYLGIGLVLSLAISAYVATQQRRQEVVEGLIADRTAELNRTTTRFSRMFETASDGIILIDQGGTILLFNQMAEHLFGYDAAEVFGLNVKMLMPESYARNHDEYLTNYQRTREAKIIGIGREVVGLRKDRTTFPLYLAVSEVVGGGQTAYLGIVRDLTAAKHAERQIAEERDTAQRYLDVAGVLILALDARGAVTMINRRGCAILGYDSDQELLGRSWIETCIPERNRGAMRDTFRRLVVGHDPNVEYHENAVLTKSGEERLIHWHNTVLTDDQGQVTGSLSSGDDVTDRRRAESELLRMKTLLAGIVESSNDAIISKTLDGIVTTWNPAAERIFGYTATEMIGRSIAILSAPRLENDLVEILERIKAGQRVDHYETQRRRKDGTVLTISLSVSPIIDNFGRIIGASKIARDITTSKAAELALRHSEEHLAKVQSIAKIGSSEYKFKTGESTWSAEIYRMIGLPPSHDTNLPTFMDRVHPDDRARLTALAARGRTGVEVEPMEFRVVDEGGVTRWYYRQSQVIRDETGAPYSQIATVFDITDRKVAEAARLISEERYRLTFDMSPVGIAHVDLNGRFILVNQTLCTMFGCDEASLLGHNFRELTHPEDMSVSDRHTARLLGREMSALSWEKRFLRKDGEIVWCRLTSTLTTGDEKTPAHYITVYTDITAAKQNEVKRAELEAQLHQAQKMEAVGRLTGGVAHDFNNLLTIVLGNLELLREQCEDNARMTRQIDAATSAGKRGSDLTHRLLAFSRRQPLEPIIIDINKRIGELVPMLHRTLGETIDVKQKLDRSLWSVVVDPGQFESAVLNLAVNSRDAMPQGGKLEISTENISVDETYAAARRELIPGDYVRVSVSDLGTGMTPEVIAQAFDPFFTTKEVGKGTGLGLSMVYGFVKQSGGHVAIYSEVGVGTTITLLLPADSTTAGERTPQKLMPPQRGTETILVVEDDPAVRAVTVSFLDALGYSVIQAGTVAEGYELFTALPTVDLILTDVILPGGADGADLAQRARALRPDIKVLFMSGYTEDVVMHNGRLDAGVALLRKPFTRLQLSQKVRAVIDGAQATD